MTYWQKKNNNKIPSENKIINLNFYRNLAKKQRVDWQRRAKDLYQQLHRFADGERKRVFGISGQSCL